MVRIRRAYALRRLFWLGICIVLTVTLCKEQVFADANYKIKLNSGVEKAVFTLSYTGEVESLAITSPAGISYDSSSCGSAYRQESGKIRIGVLYADPGLWQITITGTPDDGFRLLIISDKDYGEYAGTDSSEEPKPVPEETSVPPAATGSAVPSATEAATGPTASLATGTESAETEAVPEQIGSSTVVSVTHTENKAEAGTDVTTVSIPEKVIPGEVSRTDETISGWMSSGSGSPAYLESFEDTGMTDETLSESETVYETQTQVITGAAVLVVDNGGEPQKPSPAPGAGSGGSKNADGAVLFAAAAVTLTVIVITVGKMLRGTAGGNADQIRPRKKDKGKEQVDFRDYFPEGK
jgi:hypothetical protein